MPNSADIFIDHRVAQLEGVSYELLNDADKLLEATKQVAEALRLTVVNSFIHRFEPHGLSLVLVISQSHIAVHTWPEHSYLHIDMVTCSEGNELDKIDQVLQQVFSPTKLTSHKISY